MAIRFTDEVEETTVEKAPIETGAALPIATEQPVAQPAVQEPVVQEPQSKIRFTDSVEQAQPKSRIRFTDVEETQSKIDEVGQIQGIANAAMNAFDASRQSMAVAGGVSPEEAEEISRLEYQKEARKVAPAYQEYLEAQGLDAVKAFAKNPLEVSTNIIAEGLAGSLYSLGAGLVAGGTAAGATALTGVGAPLAPAAFLGGQIGGTFAGSLATEYGSKVLEELQNAGMDIKDPESIQKFFSDEKLVEQARSQGLKRGIPVAIFDGLSAGVAGRLARIPVQALTKTPTRLAVTEAATQAALGGGGEVAGALAAGEEIQPKAVFAEVLGEAGPAAAEITVGKIATKLAETPEQKQFNQNVLAAQVATRAAQDVAPATADIVERQVQDTLAETASESPEQRVTRLTEEAQKATGIELEEETVARFDQMARSAIIPEIKRFIPEDVRNQLNFIQDRVSKNEFKISDLDETQFKNILSPESYTQIVGLYEEDPELATQTLRNIIEENAGLPAEGGGGEEEAGVGVEPTVPVTPPIEPTPEGAVAPVEPVVTPEVAEPQPAAEVAPEPIPEVIATPEGERARAFYHSGPRPLTVETASFDKGAMGFHMGAKTQAEWVAKDKRKAEISSFYVRDASADQELETESIDRDMSWEHADALLVELVSEGIIEKQDAINLANAWGDMSADHKQALNNDLQKVEFGKEYTGIDGDVGEFMLQSSTYRNADKLGQIRKLLVDNGTGAIEYINEVEGVGGNPQAVAIFDKRMLAEAPTAPAVTPPSEVTPTPETPNLEPLRRVARSEQTPEDVPSLVGAGLVEVYKDQPVLTEAGIAQLPEAERPRLTPQARKIQIDTGSNEVVAEAISKNLRIGVDQVGADVRMPAGWTLVEDIYVPPAPQAEAPVPEVRESRIQMPRPAGMEPEAVTTKLESLGFGLGGIVSVVNEPDASFEGRTIIRDGKVVGIELNAAALKDDAAIERVLNHEIAESANASGALNRLVAGLTPKERKEINDAITRLGYAERARTAEEAARAVELLAEGWRGRKWFERAVARIEAWANKLGYKLTRRAAEYIAARNVSEINAEFKQAYNKFINVQGEIRESRREDAIPTFSEGSPEASTLSTMAESMAKVDAASEAKPNPENKLTYKISEIASVWMDQGGDTRQLQDMVVEYTNLTPVNAKRVANAIAKQYDIQQSIKTAFLETPAGVSVEALPEGVTLPKEVDPDRPRPVMQRLFDVFMGVRVPPVKITGNEKTLLKQQIRLKAAANRAAKQEQQRTADEVVEIIKSMELRGPVRPKQAQALAKRAAKVIWTSEKSMESFVEYAAKVVENANYDADLREAKAAQKRAKELSKQKKVAMSPQRMILQQIGNVAVNKLDDPRMFAEMINYYLRGFKDVRSPEYVVVPDEEITGYISQLETESVTDQAEVERETNERLARKYDLDPNTIPELMSLINIIEEIEGRENREALESILTDKAIETQDGLRGYDTSAFTNTQKKLVESMLGVDLKSINNQERQMFIRIANNMIYNNQTNGAEYFVATAKGQENARKAARDSKLIQRNQAWIPLIPSFGSLKLQETLRNFSLELQSVADTFRNVFGKDFMAKAYEMMGMLDLNEGFTKANNTIDEIQDLMAEFHQGNEKKYGDAARNQDGILSEGVAGFLIQEFPFKDEATSIQQRRNLINEYITNARASRQVDRVAMADRVEAILNKVDGASVQEILNNMKREYRPNYDSLMWYKDVLFPKYKDFLKQFDENFNDQANNYDSPNYLPIAFTSAGPALALTTEDVSIANSISLQPKQSVYTIKRQDYTTLPKDRDGNPKEIEFNLRRNAFNSLSDQINKAYTNPSWQQIFAFMKTPESIEFFGDKANRDFFVDRLNRLRVSRARRGSVSGGALEKALDSFSIISRKLGTGIALGGAFQWIKQPPDQLLTALGSGGRSDLLAKNVAPWTQKAARELLNQFSIGRRGDSSAGYKYINQMEGHQSRMERYFSESKWEQAKEQGGKIADVWMIALKKSDFIAASAAWMTYYEGELNKNDIKIDDWAKEAELVKTDPVRRQAAAYAEQMTDIYQGSSDPTSMATFAQSGKTGWENFTKALLVPFNSFAIQQRMRLYSDARDALMGNKGGIGGLSGTIGGLILFHATKRFAIPLASGGVAAIIYGLMGVDMDEPDEEKKKEMADRNWRQFLADITGNLLVGGTPQLVENRTIEAFNYASYLVGLQLESETVLDENGEIMSFDKYSKERSPFYRYKSYDNAMSLGMFEIGFDQAKETALQTKMLMDREEMEMYTPEEQRLLYFSALSEWLYLMRLNDTDFARIVKKARRDMIKAAEEREKELARIRAGR